MVNCNIKNLTIQFRNTIELIHIWFLRIMLILLLIILLIKSLLFLSYGENLISTLFILNKKKLEIFNVQKLWNIVLLHTF
jgi:hypothetical protein